MLPKSSGPGLSFRAYAKERGCSDRAVRNAIWDGRLRRSIAEYAGTIRIIDPDLADREWSENTQHDRVPMHIRRTREALAGNTHLPDHIVPAAGAAEAREAIEAAAGDVDDTLRRAEAKKKIWEAKWQELRVRERVVQLVERDAIEERWAGIVADARAKLLGIPRQFAKQVPTLTAGDIAVLEVLFDEALEELTTDR